MLCLYNDLIIKHLSTGYETVHATFETERVKRKKKDKEKIPEFVAFVLDETNRHAVQ